MADQQNLEQQQPDPTPQAGSPQAAQPADTGKHTGRKWGVGLLITLGLILLVVANVAFWAWFTLLNTNGWVAAVGPLSKDPTVSSILSQYVVTELFQQVDIEATIEQSLPPEYQILSVALTTGLEKIAYETVDGLIQSDAFNTVWVGVNRAGHTVIMKVLKGEGDNLYMQSGELVLDLSDVYNYVEDQFGLADLNLSGQAEGGRIVLFQSQQVAVLQELVSYLNTLGLLLPLLAILAFVAAWFASLWRRETLIWIGVVIAVAMFISLIVFSVTRSSVLVSVQDPMLRDLGRQIVNVVTHGLMVQTVFFLIAGILIAVGAWQAAPDSALMKWEASRKEKKAAQKSSEESAA
jgi:hypothetical protein